jgi:hypothetical protein
MALVSIQLVDGPNGLNISAAMEPGIEEDTPPEELTPAQRVGAQLFDLLMELQAARAAARAAEQGAGVIALPDKRIIVPGRQL